MDTSGDRSTIGLRTASGLVFEAETDGSRKHGRDLIPCIRTLLEQAGIRPLELGTIGVGLGPGSYTGLRIGLTAARTLAYAAGARLVGFDSLEALAGNAPESATRVLVVGDAQRGDLYAAEFSREAPGAPLVARGPTRIEPLSEWSSRVEAGDFVLASGLKSPAMRSSLAALAAIDLDDPIHRATGRGLVELTLRLAENGPPGDLWGLEPNYLRRSAAEDQWDARAARP
nr:tRNA (adenosine(37)-N6)-threonylcarbamoyltransferase complex dimerization subunit type 1 TsaB [Paludisphaera mucosa]